MAQNKKPSKNQTAGIRAAEKAALENHPTSHVCMSDKCPTPGERILLKDLLTAVAAPKRRKLYYHRRCWDNR
jgi:hypothetical protein